MFLIANPGRINDNIKPALFGGFTQDFFGHDRAADIAGTHHEDAIGHGISSLAEKREVGANGLEGVVCSLLTVHVEVFVCTFSRQI